MTGSREHRDDAEPDAVQLRERTREQTQDRLCEHDGEGVQVQEQEEGASRTGARQAHEAGLPAGERVGRS